MIGRLTGHIVGEGDGGVLVVDVNGVGYEVFAPLGTQGRATGDGGLVTLFVHTHVREDAFSLFAFATEIERDAFRTLISIANVGPKLGLAVLSAIALGDLAQAVARGEVQKLVSIPGVGKKTAERLVLELRGKLPMGAPVSTPRAAVSAPPSSSRSDLVVGALTRLGYRPAEADRVVAALGAIRDLEATPLDELVREALGLLSK